MINIIIVIYNQKMMINEKVSNKLKLIFVDNSTDISIKESNIGYAQKKYDNFTYIDMQGNKGLSKAYNKAIDVLKLREDDYVILFDQDTNFCTSVFDRYIEYIEEHPNIDIICPIVKDSVGIMSPSLMSGMKYKHLSNMEEISTKKINKYSFINSGMCIKGSVFSKLKYDESLFLDFVDHDFVRQIKNHNFAIGICFDVVLNQNFSGVTKNSFEQDFNRFKIFIEDAKSYYKKYFPKRNCKVILFKRTLKLTIIHRKFNFFLELIKLK